MPPLSVLYLIESLGPGGAERSLAELLEVCLSEGIAVTVVCLKREDIGFEADVRRTGCEVHILPPRGTWHQARAFRKLVLTKRVHLIHTTLFYANIVGRLAAVGTGVPVLTSLVNTTYEAARWSDPNVSRLNLCAVQVIDAITARFLTTHFHAITEAVKDSAVRRLWIPEERITVIERGRSRARLGTVTRARREKARRRLGIGREADVVLNVGRQEYQKGQRHLLAATALLFRSRPRLTVLVAGREGHATSDLQASAARLGVVDTVRFLGHREDIPELLAAADIFVFPSLYEGLGGAVIEAMAMGLPVVASDLPALREVVEDGYSGLLVEPGNSQKLASAMARLLDDRELRQRLGSRGKILFEQRFTLRQSADRMIRLYRRLARCRMSSGAESM